MTQLPPNKRSLDRYRGSLSLLTDLYQLTMAEAYWQNDIADTEAVFHLHFRHLPFRGGYAIACGLAEVIEWVAALRFDDEDRAFLAQVTGANGRPLFCREFLDYLGRLRFSGQIDALPEGTVVFPYEPMVRVQAPLIECQLLETALLTFINFATLVATKAARLSYAAQGEEILEFGLRRAQGVDGGLTAARAAFIGGCSATSNVLAGKVFGIPVKGTHAHSWVMAHDDELQSFENFAATFPDNTLLLVDTYDTLQGVRNAVVIAKKLRERGHRFLGIRLDSGDLAYLSIESRKILDEAGFPDAVIVGSNELDETLISELKRQGCRINVWGVGTNLVTARDQPALDGVYKMSALRDKAGQWQDKIKLSEQIIKVNNPGILQVRRYFNEREYLADALYDIRQPLEAAPVIVDPFDPTKQRMVNPAWGSKDLLVPIFRDGTPVYTPPPLDIVRQHTKDELARFHGGVKRFLNPHQYVVGLESSLYEKKVQLIKKIRLGHA